MSKTNHHRDGDKPRKDSKRYSRKQALQEGSYPMDQRTGTHKWGTKIQQVGDGQVDLHADEHHQTPGRLGWRKERRGAKRYATQTYRSRENQATKKLAEEL